MTFNYYQEISQWVQWNLYTNSETGLKRIKEVWGHTMTLMLPQYNLRYVQREAYWQMADVSSVKALQEHMQV